MTDHEAGSREWLDQVKEEIIDPEREIVDPHHHLWRRVRWFKYILEDLWSDTGSGHNVRKTVFVQCRSSYRTGGPEHLKPVGETEFYRHTISIPEASFPPDLRHFVMYVILPGRDTIKPQEITWPL